MATRSIKPKREDTMLSDWQSMPESAPSTIRKEGSVAAQLLLFVGLFFGLIGILALVPLPEGWHYFIRPGFGYMALTIGAALVLYHCFVEREPQFRLLYTMAAFGLIVGGIFVRLVVLTRDNADGYFYAIGLPMLIAALAFLIGVVRHESDPVQTRVHRFVLLLAGAVMIGYAAVRGHLSADFLASEGIVFLLLGLAYIGAYLGLSGDREDLAPTVAWALVIAAGLNLTLAVVRSLTNDTFFIPSGVIFVGVSLLAFLIAGLLLSDWPMVVLFKRELNGYFFSPIAYLVLLGCAIIFAINFFFFREKIGDRMGMPEPIMRAYVIDLFPVIGMMALVPILTMRVFSEEKRSGSLEVLLTAPINEGSVVLGKLLAATVFFLVAWLPFFLYLVALRVFGGNEFDFRPVLSFALALAITGGSLVAVGLFFSSLTSNQLIAAVFTFAVMVGEIMIWFLQGMMPGNLGDFLGSLSFIELWKEAATGILPLKLYALHAAVGVFFAFLTTLVLSARKWK
jgi:ABC-2 type transport system permease protein